MKEGLFLKPSSGTGAGTQVIGSSGNITSPSTISATGSIKSETAVTGVTVSSYAMLLAKHAEAGIQVCAANSGSWAAWIGMTTGSRHYWWHNAPSSGANGGDLELRTSTTTTAAQIGGQGNDSSVLLTVSNAGDVGIGIANNSSYKLYVGGSIAQSSGSIYSFGDVVIGNGSLKKGTTTVIDANLNATLADVDASGDINVSGDIVMSGANNFLVIENSEENDAGIIFNDLQAGAWPAASSQRFQIAYNSSTEKLIMGHDDGNYNPVPF